MVSFLFSRNLQAFLVQYIEKVRGHGYSFICYSTVLCQSQFALCRLLKYWNVTSSKVLIEQKLEKSLQGFWVECIKRHAVFPSVILHLRFSKYMIHGSLFSVLLSSDWCFLAKTNFMLAIVIELNSPLWHWAMDLCRIPEGDTNIFHTLFIFAFHLVLTNLDLHAFWKIVHHWI